MQNILLVFRPGKNRLLDMRRLVPLDTSSLKFKGGFCTCTKFSCAGPITVNSEIFARVYFRETYMRSFVTNKPSRIGEITLSFTDIGKSGSSCEFLTPQICLLTIFAKIKFSRKFPNLQYYLLCSHQIQ